MKKITLLFIILFSLNSFSNDSLKVENKSDYLTKTAFCEGWEEGYCEGWKDVKGQFSICPIAPICPIPPVGKNTYKGGYNMGFKAGMKKAKNS